MFYFQVMVDVVMQSGKCTNCEEDVGKFLFSLKSMETINQVGTLTLEIGQYN